MPQGEDKDNHSAEALQALADGHRSDSAGTSSVPHSVSAQERASSGGASGRVVAAQALPLGGVLVPLLLVIGILLLVLCGVTATMLLDADADKGATPLRTYGPVLIIAACPLATILLAGAWLVYTQTHRRAGKR